MLKFNYKDIFLDLISKSKVSNIFDNIEKCPICGKKVRFYNDFDDDINLIQASCKSNNTHLIINALFNFNDSSFEIQLIDLMFFIETYKIVYSFDENLITIINMFKRYEIILNGKFDNFIFTSLKKEDVINKIQNLLLI